jgi:hypothetical protein
MPLNTRIKPFGQRPFDANLSPQTNQWLDQLTTAVNALIGTQPPPSIGFSALAPAVVNPASTQITSVGSRPQSIATKIAVVAQPTSISFHWDGTNGSTPLSIYRDDYSIITPMSGHMIVTGLSANTTYYFYPFYDERDATIKWVDDTRPTPRSLRVGTPQIAFTSASVLGAQSQIFNQHISLAASLGSAGITTPNAGSTSSFTTGGGGGAGVSYPIGFIPQFPRPF